MLTQEGETLFSDVEAVDVAKDKGEALKEELREVDSIRISRLRIAARARTHVEKGIHETYRPTDSNQLSACLC